MGAFDVLTGPPVRGRPLRAGPVKSFGPEGDEMHSCTRSSHTARHYNMAKRTQLRSKVSRGGTRTNKQGAEGLPEDPQAFLHAYKETKLQKMTNKHQGLMSKLSASTISKSSLRRQKRREKDDLKPKMHDLLDSLEGTMDTVNVVEKPIFIEKKKAHLPSTRTKKGLHKVEEQERARFGAVLKDQHFKKSPFEALRESIALRLQEEKK